MKQFHHFACTHLLCLNQQSHQSLPKFDVQHSPFFYILKTVYYVKLLDIALTFAPTNLDLFA